MGKDKQPPRKGPNKRAGETGQDVNGYLHFAFTKDRKKQYCKSIEENGLRMQACKEVGVSLKTVQNHLKKDPDFREMYEESMSIYRESLEREAYRRAVKGNPKAIYFQGSRVKDIDDEGNEVPAVIRDYDTPLLTMLLKRHLPEYRDKQVVENHNMNVDMGLKDVSKLTPEQRKKMREIMDLEKSDD